MTTRAHVAAIFLCFGVAALPAIGGQIIGSPTGLISPAVTINFTEYGILQNTVLTNQYAALGVTFSSGMYEVGSPGDAAANFLPSGGAATTPFSLYFTSVQSSAAVILVTNEGTSTFTALLGGSLVDSFSASTGPQRYYGFTSENFDQIQITPGGFLNVGVLTRIELGPAVPEPSTCALLGTGLLGLLAWRRKRTA
jgi:hypothetical protein